MWLVEKRRTVGAFTTIGADADIHKAKSIMEEAIEDLGYPEADAQWRDPTPEIPFCVKYGNEHNNIILRIRKI